VARAGAKFDFDLKTEAHKALPMIAALTAAAPAHAEGMQASFLPPIMVPLVGIVLPFLSMGAFFVYSQKEDL
jgi:photosystem I reaction center subunit VIII